LVQASAQFYAPASFGDNVVVESRIVEWGKSSFRVEHKLFKGSALGAEGREKRVWTVRDGSSEKGMRGVAIPEEVMARFVK